MSLIDAVDTAVQWATGADAKSHPRALAELAKSLAKEIENPAPVAGGRAPSTAQLAKELRVTLEDLEAMRDDTDAEASLAVVMSTPVWDEPESGKADARPARRGGGGKSRKAADAVAKPRSRRGAGAAS